MKIIYILGRGGEEERLFINKRGIKNKKYVIKNVKDSFSNYVQKKKKNQKKIKKRKKEKKKV